MKFVIVLACFLALAAAGPVDDVKVLRSDAEVNPDGFKYAYELDNSVKAEQSGVQTGEQWSVNGQYEYISPEGKTIKVTYTADESGYHPHVQL